MLIRGRRIRSLQRHLAAVPEGATVVVALGNLATHLIPLERTGFSELRPGETRLPRPCGPVSLYNAEGRHDRQRNQPMETAYRQVQWHWTEFHGLDRIQRSEMRDVPYSRYPRKFSPPPSVELTLIQRDSGVVTLVAPPIQFDVDHHDLLRHTINLFLELFGECSILTYGLVPFAMPPLRRLNWRILPPGEMPWPHLSRQLDPILRDLGERTRPVVEHRLRLLTEEHTPDFAAAGVGGFTGYLVFGFDAKQRYVIESLLYGNATYVFDKNWEAISRLSKREILDTNLQFDRLIHVAGWDTRVRQTLG